MRLVPSLAMSLGLALAALSAGASAQSAPPLKQAAAGCSTDSAKALDHGVSVLAWARVDGVSPMQKCPGATAPGEKKAAAPAAGTGPVQASSGYIRVKKLNSGG